MAMVLPMELQLEMGLEFGVGVVAEAEAVVAFDTL